MEGKETGTNISVSTWKQNKVRILPCYYLLQPCKEKCVRCFGNHITFPFFRLNLARQLGYVIKPINQLDLYCTSILGEAKLSDVAAKSVSIGNILRAVQDVKHTLNKCSPSLQQDRFPFGTQPNADKSCLWLTKAIKITHFCCATECTLGLIAWNNWDYPTRPQSYYTGGMDLPLCMKVTSTHYLD